jgi:drug/metabolite transporter (DMT)-like permease
MLVEPVTGVLLAALLLAEQPALVQLAGGVLVLVGAALVQLTPAASSGATVQPTAE